MLGEGLELVLGEGSGLGQCYRMRQGQGQGHGHGSHLWMLFLLFKISQKQHIK